MIKMVENSFECFEDLTNIKDSLEFDSGTCIATCKLTNGDTMDLMVYGEVKIDYSPSGNFDSHDGERYCQPSDFDDDMKKMLKDGTFWTSKKIDILNNNWFEIICGNNADVADGVEGCTKEQIKEFFEDTINLWYNDKK